MIPRTQEANPQRQAGARGYVVKNNLLEIILVTERNATTISIKGTGGKSGALMPAILTQADLEFE